MTSKFLKKYLPVALIIISIDIHSQKSINIPNKPSYNLETDDDDTESLIPQEWYKKLKVSGYMQVRNNDIYQTNPDLTCPQCDKTYGGYNGFSLRRMRFKITGWLHPKVYYYFQADFASDGKNLGQLRDAYADIYLNKNNTWRLRVGQSKIPYGYENLQSSQNRLGLDRNDPLNSAVKDERDIMVVGYWTNKDMKQRFKDIKSKGLKGSGDYGNLGIAVYNGQRANSYSANDHYHGVLRFTWPFMLKNGQYIETSIQGYHGRYSTLDVSEGVTVKDKVSTEGEPIAAHGYDFVDQRVAATLIIYPQPFGFQSEFNVGRGPEYDPETNTIGEEDLIGGYAQLMYLYKKNKMWLMPFCRAQYYDGGKKFELDARSYTVKELELGIEWSPFPALELNTTYTFSNRRYEDAQNPVNHQKGQLLRVQLQINY